MNKKQLWLFLVLEFLAILAPILGFKYAPSYVWALVIANGSFLSFSLFLLFNVWKWADRKKSLCFWMANIQFIFGVLPLSLTRLFYLKASSLPHVLGFPSAYYHKFSEILFGLLILATLYDLVSCYRKKKID